MRGASDFYMAPNFRYNIITFLNINKNKIKAAVRCCHVLLKVMSLILNKSFVYRAHNHDIIVASIRKVKLLHFCNPNNNDYSTIAIDDLDGIRETIKS